MLLHVLALVTGYLIGGIPFAYLTSKLKGLDIRYSGSGNVGTLNTLRTAGIGIGLITLILEVGKGAAVVFLARAMGSGDTLPLFAAFGAILGHMFPVYLGFRGGKSLAVYIGSMGVLYFPVLFFIGFVWVLFWFFSRQVALSSAVAFGSAPIFILIAGEPVPLLVYSILAGVFITLRHREDMIKKN